MLFSMTIAWEWRGAFRNEEINQLHAEGFDHAYVEHDWTDVLSRLSLGWVTARDDQGLVGFVNVIWDGHAHAFIEDTLVAQRARRQGVGKRLLAVATEQAREAGCEWIHVDFDDHLKSFYFDACGFRPTSAGLIRLR
jgi:GNAT superfamily N-acetyltransferase